MLSRFPLFIKVPVIILSLALNLLVIASAIALLGVFKLLPIKPWQHLCTTFSHFFYRLYIYVNSGVINLTSNPDWHVTINRPLKAQSWNLVICNHRSWLDIMVLMHVLGRYLPPPKFFLKRDLLYVPFIGIASWALDMPFVHRYSRQTLRKKPHLKGRSLENAKRSCEKFRKTPTTIVNFVEGTRLTSAKHQRQNSPYQHLLKPQAAGIAFTLAAMGEQFDNLIDVTLDYPETDLDSPLFKQVLLGKVKAITVHVDANPIEPELMGDYFADKAFRTRFQKRLNEKWQKKDELLSVIQSGQAQADEENLAPLQSEVR